MHLFYIQVQPVQGHVLLFRLHIIFVKRTCLQRVEFIGTHCCNSSSGGLDFVMSKCSQNMSVASEVVRAQATCSCCSVAVVPPTLKVRVKHPIQLQAVIIPAWRRFIGTRALLFTSPPGMPSNLAARRRHMLFSGTLVRFQQQRFHRRKFAVATLPTDGSACCACDRLPSALRCLLLGGASVFAGGTHLL